MKTFFLSAVALTVLYTGSAHAGVITTYDSGPQQTCREFTSTINVGSRRQEGYGTACLQSDGSWQIVSGPGTGTSFYDNDAPVAYPANSYYTSQNVYYQEPVRVHYVVRERPVYYNPPIIVARYGRDWGPGWGYGYPYSRRAYYYDRGHGPGMHHWHGR